MFWPPLHDVWMLLGIKPPLCLEYFYHRVFSYQFKDSDLAFWDKPPFYCYRCHKCSSFYCSIIWKITNWHSLENEKENNLQLRTFMYSYLQADLMNNVNILY